jgi:hypothetical protein
MELHDKVHLAGQSLQAFREKTQLGSVEKMALRYIEGLIWEAYEEIREEAREKIKAKA